MLSVYLVGINHPNHSIWRLLYYYDDEHTIKSSSWAFSITRSHFSNLENVFITDAVQYKWDTLIIRQKKEEVCLSTPHALLVKSDSVCTLTMFFISIFSFFPGTLPFCSAFSFFCPFFVHYDCAQSMWHQRKYHNEKDFYENYVCYIA